MSLSEKLYKHYPWLASIKQEFLSGNAHSFILDFNIQDYIFDPDSDAPPPRLPRFLQSLLVETDYLDQSFDLVLRYSRPRGIEIMKGHDVLNELEGRMPAGKFLGNPTSPSTQGPVDEIDQAFTYMDGLFRAALPEPDRKGNSPSRIRIALILEYMEALSPRGSESIDRSESASLASQMLNLWALDRSFQKNHLIIGLAADLYSVSSRLIGPQGDTKTYRVNFPAEEERRQYIEWALKQYKQPVTALGENVFKLTAGFNYDGLRDLLSAPLQNKMPLDPTEIEKRKRRIIEEESAGNLEFIEKRHGLNDIAGYGYVKSFLQKIGCAIRSTEDSAGVNIVPKGILMLGPPGTGKSYMAAALAQDIGFNMVKLRNIQAPHVGESERNLERVLTLLQNIHPVIVFVDEIDQGLGKRSTYSGDGGVQSRMFQRMLEFMALDENRRRILWVAASNRPDLIDSALISRFDMVIPFLLPDPDARQEMLTQIFPQKFKVRFEGETTDTRQVIDQTVGFSGRELDTLARRALQIWGQGAVSQEDPLTSTHYLEALQDYRRARRDDEYSAMTYLAIQNTNFRAFLPEWEALPEEIRSDPEKKGQKVDEEKLSQELVQLMARLQW